MNMRGGEGRGGLGEPISTFGGVEGVREEHGDGHGADSPRNGCNGRDQLQGFLIADVALEPVAILAVGILP